MEGRRNCDKASITKHAGILLVDGPLQNVADRIPGQLNAIQHAKQLSLLRQATEET